MSTPRNTPLTRAERWVIPSLVTLALAAFGATWITDPRLPTAHEWQIVGLLAAVAVAGTLIAWRASPTDSQSNPPWSVDTIWLLPAALLAPPTGVAPLLALSVGLGMARRAQPFPARLLVAAITLFTVAEFHWATRIFDNVLLAGVVGIIAMQLTGLACAVIAQNTLNALIGAALWMDYRWSYVQLGCAFSGLLTAAAIGFEPLAALTALAPMLMGVFTLNWPELDRHARIDAKTGLPNAQHWDERSRELIEAASLLGAPVSVAMIDIDHFKHVNDSYGHLVGDEVLQALAATLRSQVNPGDVIGRFGGEEFVITLFGLPADEVPPVAERIRAAVAAQVHSTRARLGLDAGSHHGAVGPNPPTFSITCTIGVASSGTFGHDLPRMLAAADTALAEGKSRGRNQVCVGTNGAPGPA